MKSFLKKYQIIIFFSLTVIIGWFPWYTNTGRQRPHLWASPSRFDHSHTHGGERGAPGYLATDDSLAGEHPLVPDRGAIPGRHPSGWGRRSCDAWGDSSTVPTAQAKSIPDIASPPLRSQPIGFRLHARARMAGICTGENPREMGTIGWHAYPGHHLWSLASAGVLPRGFGSSFHGRSELLPLVHPYGDRPVFVHDVDLQQHWQEFIDCRLFGTRYVQYMACCLPDKYGSWRTISSF